MPHRPAPPHTGHHNGQLPLSVQPHLLSCRLVAPNKPSGVAGDVRPIAVGELFYRLASIVAVNRVSESAAALLQPHQYGIGVPGGNERIVHSLQHGLVDDPRHLAALKVDLTNAFNSCDRAVLLAKLHDTPDLAQVLRLSHLAYTSASPLLLQKCNGQQIDSANGVRQGDPLSSLLFCLYIHETLVDLADSCGITNFAFIDDLHILGTPSQVLAAYQRLQQNLPSLSLTINARKSQLLYFHEDTHPLPSHIRDSFEALAIRVEHRHAVVLGAVIGASDADITQGLQHYWDSTLSMTPFFRRLNTGLLSVQNGMLLLRICGGMKLHYVLRCTPPRLVERVAEAFDAVVMDTALRLLDIQPGEYDQHIRFWLRAPLRQGGFGLTSSRLLAPSAYISSLAAISASPLTSVFSAFGRGTAEVDDASHLGRWIRDALDDLRSPPSPFLLDPDDTRFPPPAKLASILPPLHAPFFPHYHHQPSRALSLQRKLIQQATKHQLTYATSELVNRWGETRAYAHLHSIAAPHAPTWKTVHPTSTLHLLTDAQYRIATRLNLGLPPHHNHLPHKCTSCGRENALVIDPWHHLSCNSHKGREITMRHNAVLLALYSHVRAAGGTATMEPRHLSQDKELKPDLHISFPGQQILTDVVISHPLCPTHVDKSSTKQLVLAEWAAQRKHYRYDDVARQHHMRLLPFSVETMGGLSSEAQQLVEQIGLACRDHLCLETHERIARGVLASVAVAVQKGNAVTMQAAYSRAVMRGRHPAAAVGA